MVAAARNSSVDVKARGAESSRSLYVRLACMVQPLLALGELDHDPHEPVGISVYWSEEGFGFRGCWDTGFRGLEFRGLELGVCLGFGILRYVAQCVGLRVLSHGCYEPDGILQETSVYWPGVRGLIYSPSLRGVLV